MSESTFKNILSFRPIEFEIIQKNIAYVQKEPVYITNGNRGQLPFNVKFSLRGLTEGDDFNKSTKTVGDTPKQKEEKLVYKKIVLSIVRICSGLSTISLGLLAWLDSNEDVDELPDQRDIVLAHLLKAFHQVKHGIIWDEGDECIDNNTHPTDFFYSDAKERKLHDSNKDGARDGTTGWSKDDLEDDERIEHPLFTQLFQAAGIGESDFEMVFPTLYLVDSEISSYMSALHSKLQNVEGTNDRLNLVRNKNLRQYSLGIQTIPLYLKEDWIQAMSQKMKKKKKKKKKKLQRPLPSEHSSNTNGTLVNTPETDCEVSDHHRLLSSFNNMPYSPPLQRPLPSEHSSNTNGTLVNTPETDCEVKKTTRISVSPIQLQQSFTHESSAPESPPIQEENVSTSNSNHRQLYEDFVTTHGLFGLKSINENYTRGQTVVNGHCGPDGLFKAAKNHHNKRLDPNVKGADSYEQLINYDGEQGTLFVQERKKLKNHFLNALDHPNYQDMFVTADGTQNPSFKGTRQRLTEDIGCRLYENGMNGMGCGLKNYFDTTSMAVAAHFYKKSIVVYSEYVSPLYRATVFHEYCNERNCVITMTFDEANLPEKFKGMYLSSRPTDICVLFINKMVHFESLFPIDAKLPHKAAQQKPVAEKAKSTKNKYVDSEAEDDCSSNKAAQQKPVAEKAKSTKNKYVDSEAEDDCSSNSYPCDDDDEELSGYDMGDAFINDEKNIEEGIVVTERDHKIYCIAKKVQQALNIISSNERNSDGNLPIQDAQSAKTLLQEVNRDLKELVDGRPPPTYKEPSISSDTNNEDAEGGWDTEMENKQGCQDIQTELNEGEQDTADDKGPVKRGAEIDVDDTREMKKPRKSLKSVEPSALLNQLASIRNENHDLSGEYVMAYLDIVQCLADLIHSCFNSNSLCFDKLQQGLTCLIKAMGPHVKNIAKFVMEPVAQVENNLISAFDQKAGLGQLLGTMDGVGNVSEYDDADKRTELKKIKTAIWKSSFEGSVPSEDSLDKKVGPSYLKKRLILTDKTKNIMIHCLHILLVDRVITNLVITNSVCHLSGSDSNALREQLGKVSETLFADKDEEAPSSGDIDSMTIKMLLNRIILPAIMKGGECEVKIGTDTKPLWQVATKAMITIFLGLVGHDSRGKREDGACAKDLYKKNIISVMRKAQSENIVGDATSTVAGEEDYCCSLDGIDKEKHKGRRRRIIITYLMLLLRKPIERAQESSHELLDELNSYFGSYSGSLLRLSPTEMYTKTTSLISTTEDISINTMKDLFAEVKKKGNFEKIYLLITSKQDMENLSSLASFAYPNAES